MKNKFKTAIVLFAVLTGMLLADCAMAQEKGVRVKVGADFVSSYIWRGSYKETISLSGKRPGRQDSPINTSDPER